MLPVWKAPGFPALKFEVQTGQERRLWAIGLTGVGSTAQDVCPLCARHLLYAPVGAFYFFVFLLHHHVSGLKPGSAGILNPPHMSADNHYRLRLYMFQWAILKSTVLIKIRSLFSTTSFFHVLLQAVQLKRGACVELLDTEVSYSTATV